MAEAEALAEAETAASAADAAAAVAAAGADAVAAAGAAIPKTSYTMSQTRSAENRAQATSAAQARKAEAAPKTPTAEKGAHGPTVLQQARAAPLPLDTEDWELSEGGLPEGSTLSGSKALMEDYPKDEANSKKVKKTDNNKGKKNKSKA